MKSHSPSGYSEHDGHNSDGEPRLLPTKGSEAINTLMKKMGGGGFYYVKDNFLKCQIPGEISQIKIFNPEL